MVLSIAVWLYSLVPLFCTFSGEARQHVWGLHWPGHGELRQSIGRCRVSTHSPFSARWSITNWLFIDFFLYYSVGWYSMIWDEICIDLITVLLIWLVSFWYFVPAFLKGTSCENDYWYQQNIRNWKNYSEEALLHDNPWKLIVKLLLSINWF